jgi:GT2 family glycosyltransferase
MTARETPGESGVRLSVIVVSSGTRELLDECLTALGAATDGLETEVIVVDNASLDGSAELVRDRHGQIFLIENDSNVGFARANNQALRIARGEYAVLLNSDTVSLPGSLRRLVAFMDAHGDVGACAPRLVDEHGGPDSSASGLPNLRMQTASFLSLKRLVPRRLVSTLLAMPASRAVLQRLTAGYFTPILASDSAQTVDFLSGACLLVRRQVWETVGLLDERIFMYLEDADWCRRIASAGWSLSYVPDVTVIHLGGRSFAARTDGRTHHLSEERIESLLYYFRKHEGGPRRVLLKGIVAASLLARSVRSTIAGDRSEAERLRSLVRFVITS